MRLLLAGLSFFLASGAVAMDWGIEAHLPAWAPNDPAPALDRAQEMHFNWARLDLNWNIVEPSPMEDLQHDGNWQAFDASVHAVRARGIKILAILGSTPSWGSTSVEGPGTFNDMGKEHWPRYVRAILERYKDDIDHFEIGNEPNLSQFWKG